jgi:CheY-like chemotaxis protein
MSSTRFGEPASHGRLRILVADDHEILRRAVQNLLTKLGHSVEAVANGREVLEAAARQAFDVLFLDIEMPLMGGIEAAYWVRRLNTGRQPVIIGFSGEAHDQCLEEKGLMDDFLLKPLTLSDLVRTLETTARRSGDVFGDIGSVAAAQCAPSPNPVAPMHLSNESA